MRPARPFTIAVVVALHALLTVGGSGLHALPGMGHGSELNRPSRQDHTHGPGKSSHDLTKECPVCQYLGGEQARIEDQFGPITWDSAARPPITSDTQPRLESQRYTATRAPPAAS